MYVLEYISLRKATGISQLKWVHTIEIWNYFGTIEFSQVRQNGIEKLNRVIYKE